MTNKSQKKRKIRRILITLGCCCIIAAAALSTYNYFDDQRAAQAAEELTSTLSLILEQSKPEQTPPPIDEQLTQIDMSENAEIAPDSIAVDTYEVCGILNIPGIRIKLAIIQDWSYPNLNISACRYTGAPDGQMIIMAHNYRNHFGKLGELMPGDSISYTDIYGNECNYTVTGTEIWATNQLREIISGDWDLTLFTCTYGGANRVVVRCVKE